MGDLDAESLRGSDFASASFPYSPHGQTPPRRPADRAPSRRPSPIPPTEPIPLIELVEITRSARTQLGRQRDAKTIISSAPR
ncbi:MULTISPECIES: hypothetical protein [unclassified Gordonia (in: high G+C Gram-positive bacteria)]|uniref:hypothetical protein n=1 Tax=unclassified Gordonia (in: high G+C Gram-positive bacteria) TaxID=2657482 RepID=UPI0012E7D165|nr:MULTISPECIES: hypothetical protein [unclassified Gordonia (in: high G+C Gram-positive bacteria)]